MLWITTNKKLGPFQKLSTQKKIFKSGRAGVTRYKLTFLSQCGPLPQSLSGRTGETSFSHSLSLVCLMVCVCVFVCVCVCVCLCHSRNCGCTATQFIIRNISIGRASINTKLHFSCFWQKNKSFPKMRKFQKISHVSTTKYNIRPPLSTFLLSSKKRLGKVWVLRVLRNLSRGWPSIQLPGFGS